MTQTSRHGQTLAAAAKRVALLGSSLLLAALGTIGCSESNLTSPTSPALRESLSSSAKKPVGGDTLLTAPTDSIPATTVPEAAIAVIPVPVTGAVYTTTRRISAASGGFVSAGRHTVFFAAGALKHDTDITVTDVSNQVGHVEVELYPEGLAFKADVALWTRTWDVTSVTGWHIYWITTDADGTKKGEDQGGEAYSIGGLGILAHLEHFSIYRPGKAGW